MGEYLQEDFYYSYEQIKILNKKICVDMWSFIIVFVVLCFTILWPTVDLEEGRLFFGPGDHRKKNRKSISFFKKKKKEEKQTEQTETDEHQL